jgi:MarR family transcriptional regulator, organic hydroperoxide resistance regulator
MNTGIVFNKTVSFMLAKVSTGFRNSLERHMNTIGLHGGQIFILVELWNTDGLRQVDLATRLSLSAPTVNKMLRGLLEVKLVTREREDADSRSTRIYLTADGLAIRDEVEAQWLELEESTLAGLTETERLVLLELLGKLRTTYTGRDEEEDD